MGTKSRKKYPVIGFSDGYYSKLNICELSGIN